MAAFTEYLETALLNHVLRGEVAGTGFAQPSAVYVALFVQATTDALTSGGPPAEVSTVGTNYARQQVTFAVPASGQVANTADVVFPQASSGWGTVTHVAIFDAQTNGHALFHGPLATPKTVNTADTFRFLAGQLVVGLD